MSFQTHSRVDNSLTPGPPNGASESEATLSYAFLIHSQKTLTQNLPPRVDNKLLARQKRRRTSPEDYTILEAEYQQNPKPDKTARASIVNRVALGEKEVQIWFQNRRQNDRRKSKPLQPHELPGPRVLDDSSNQPGSDDDSIPTEPEQSHESEETDSHEKLSVENDDVLVPPIDEPPRSFDDTTSRERDGNEHQIQSSQTSPVSTSSQWSQCQQHSMQKPEMGCQEIRSPEESRPLQLTKRKRSFSDLQNEEPESAEDFDVAAKHDLCDTKSPPSLRISMSVDGEAMVRKAGELTPPKARSAVRISMSSDGEALIRTEDEPSPLKNRICLLPNRRHRLSGLRRSNSAVHLPISRAGLFDREVEGKPFGRSRDSRTWGSYCDTDARSALSTPFSAKNISGDIARGLVRSRSQRSLTFGEHNILKSRPGLLNQMIGGEQLGDKRKLSRTVSSLGRLESGQKAMASKTPTKSPYARGFKCDDNEDLELQVGDSDKENWIPGTGTSTTTRRRVARMPSGRSVLNERDVLPAEVSAFMSRSDASSREEDLDCIQGLLSLSQGAWR
ncbi:hypothetical protein V8E54_002328 [Elaphomyces granulatus]